MKFFVFAVSALATVLAQNGQDRICTPSIYNVKIYDFRTKISGNLAVDFNRNLTVTVFPILNLRLVYNLTSMIGVKFVPGNRTGPYICSREHLSIAQAPLYCLSVYARNQFDRPMRIGPPGRGGMNILSYDVPLTETLTMKTFFTNTTPPFPILRQLIGATGPYTGNLVFFTNSRITTDPSAQMLVPETCHSTPFDN